MSGVLPHFKSSHFYPKFRKGTCALVVVMRATSRLKNDPATDWIRQMLCMLNQLNHDASSAAMQFSILRGCSSIRSIRLAAARCVLGDAECILFVFVLRGEEPRGAPRCRLHFPRSSRDGVGAPEPALPERSGLAGSPSEPSASQGGIKTGYLPGILLGKGQICLLLVIILEQTSVS